MRKADAVVQQNEYQIRPKAKEKFRPDKMKEKVREILNTKLKSTVYQAEIVQPLSKELAESIRYTLKMQGPPRYKYMVQVIIGEQKGQGVRVGSRCFWDFDTDYCASETFTNDSLFCLVTVFAVYVYQRKINHDSSFDAVYYISHSIDI
eukprot:TRINITY_DN4030_c0_g1_i1.p1 TRINITY_DN4030_c0_g1~~TRINITY_DN4030_c0_g1_i1.p1  ORF type:complete len:149 (+),score=25.85 TRINITY_DN4030_c0_g1_i1:162-608(+)